MIYDLLDTIFGKLTHEKVKKNLFMGQLTKIGVEKVINHWTLCFCITLIEASTGCQ